MSLFVCCGEFSGSLPSETHDPHKTSEVLDQKSEIVRRLKDLHGPLESGLTIIYVPTRKETLKIAKYLGKFGIRAAAYHAGLPKAHLRHVHDEFHHNGLEVVVATIAFGMGIDKSNVRKIIHYGWPQSLEAYYQEAGRAGRDGKLSDCVLYGNLSRIPSLLPNKRSKEQARKAYKMLTDCFRYGMNTSTCRARVLVNYFGENFNDEQCHICDICAVGAPDLLNLKEESDAFLQVLANEVGSKKRGNSSYLDNSIDEYRRELPEKLDLRIIISKIREKFQKFLTSEKLWWQGLARILEDKGYIREADDVAHVCIKYPEITELGIEFLKSDENLHEYPEADMLLSAQMKQPYSTFSDWGSGWADPDIRRQRLKRSGNKTRRKGSKKRRRRWSKSSENLSTSRGRLSAKLSKKK
ncbi:hypothetical protein ZOSMA_463G00060 [Zostera marina]|uniref:DNA 3'-5' helicase n=1 Tax=Zostera marina TaxID=29655 RepID=A0A0K9P2F6_ZOSMR|nr:hypothetical protein ZOSMA_463G00060 [Zostera marina]